MKKMFAMALCIVSLCGATDDIMDDIHGQPIINVDLTQLSAGELAILWGSLKFQHQSIQIWKQRKKVSLPEDSKDNISEKELKKRDFSPPTQSKL